jgi:tetratricopeptide (TPR) repeat protein
VNVAEDLKQKADDLVARAGQRPAEKADKLFEKAGKTYLEALAVDPEYYPALNAWAAALISQAQMKCSEEAGECYDQATDKLHQVEVISPGSGSYNLACIAALRGLRDECRKWLENGPRHGKIPRREHIETDPDLASVRGETWFQGFLEKVDE